MYIPTQPDQMWNWTGTKPTELLDNIVLQPFHRMQNLGSSFDSSALWELENLLLAEATWVADLKCVSSPYLLILETASLAKPKYDQHFSLFVHITQR